MISIDEQQKNQSRPSALKSESSPLNPGAASTEKWKRYEFIVNTSKELMALINREYQYEAVNDAHCQARNQTREEIIGRTVSDLWSEDTFLHTVKEPLDRCFAGQEVNYQAYYEHAAIGLRYMDVSCYPYYNAAGEVTHVVVVQRDITEQERAEQAMRRYAQRLETLHEIDRGILAAQSPEEIAEAALKHLQFLVPCQQASIVIFNPSSVLAADKTIEMSSHHQVMQRKTTKGRVFELERVRTLAQFSNVDVDENADNNVDHDTNGGAKSPMSFVNIPLVVQGELLGTLSMGSNEPTAFAGEHADIAREVAYQVALAVQQAQLRQTLRRYTTELEVLVSERTQEIERRRQVAEGMRDILTILNSVRPLDEVLEYILSQAQLLLDTDAVAFFGLPEYEDAADVQPAHNLQTNTLNNEEHVLSEHLVQRAVAQQEPIIISELSLRSLRQANVDWSSAADLSAIRYRAILVMPLVVNQEAYGAIALYYTMAHQFLTEEIGTAASLADQAALAMENARLHQRAEQVAILEERERLARDLHDSVTQSLYSLTLFSEAGQRLIRTGDTQRVQEYLNQLGETAQQALKEMRLLLYELRPTALEHEGLIGALRRRLDAVEQRAGVRVAFDVTDSLVLPPPVEEALYRIAQEALNNSLKHANAEHVTVRLARDAAMIVMQIVDDGDGFTVEHAHEAGGMGLGNMRERVSKLGGQLDIESTPGTGTVVSVRIEQTDVVQELTGVKDLMQG